MRKIKIDLINKIHPKYSQMLEYLVLLGYTKVNMVLEPGEFAVRGSIIDIFAANHSHPFRIEYFDNEIERLNSFNLHTQRSISKIKKTEILVFNESQREILFQSLNEQEIKNELLSEIHEGDYVVHELYGIGIYKGLKRLVIREHEGEYAFIQYKGKDKLFVPINNFQFLHKYDGGGIVPNINGLYDSSWNRIKKRVTKATTEVAEDLYLLYKIRSKKQGYSFSEDSVWQIDLEATFPHEETPDQAKVTAEIKKDMESPKPMDRLLCGDVGYGKTEVLIRTSFKAIENNKQVAIITPTTLLAQQHYQTFKPRLANFPFQIEVLSRFRDKKEQEEIVEKLKQGKIDIIIGTQRLLQKDIEFFDLGLLIIDEEQQFGVNQKEKIKQLKQNIDVITVSATPIPRTLYMSLTGAKDLSNISTAPLNRKPILTCVAEYSDQMAKTAIKKELKRQGQVFYVYNQVKTTLQKYCKLKKLFPTVTITIAHGQMKEKELQKAISSFIKKETQILLCTTIIGYGMDLPNVNTIILDMAENFGLSQIHQLRGRVGRSEKQAYAYLLHTKDKKLTEKAKKRLQAIKEYTMLGAGYNLALKDLEIRGAGTLLGHKQHGHMTAVGFELYCKLLSESVANAKHKKKQAKRIISINKDVKAFIPETYISNSRERLSIYKRIMSFEYKNQMINLKQELEDRYGPMPQLVGILFKNIEELLN